MKSKFILWPIFSFLILMLNGGFIINVLNGQSFLPVKVLVFGPPGWEGRGGLENVLDQLGVIPGYLTYEFIGDNIPNFWDTFGAEIHISEAVNLSTLLNFDVLVIDDEESNAYADRVFYNQQDKELLKNYLDNGGRIVSWYEIYLQGRGGPVDLTLSELFGYSSLDTSVNTNEISTTDKTPQRPYAIDDWTMVRALQWGEWVPTNMIKMIPNQADVWAISANSVNPFATSIATPNTVLFGEAFSCNFEHVDGPRDDDPLVTISDYGMARLFINALLFPYPISVTIDIKPGSDPNSINLGSQGNVPVAIFSTTDFDATTVDPMSVTLAGAEVKIKGKGTPMSTAEDVNGDGLLDLIVHVDTTALELSEGDTVAVLEGETYDGVKIRGEDSVRIVP